MDQTRKTVPSVSVVSPAYQAARFIGAAIESVMSQSYEDWEYIIVDDCSSDGTPEIIDRYVRTDPRITLIRNERNLGPSNARNTAILATKGRYLAFLDSDDLWEKEKLTEQVRFMNKPGLALTYTAYTRINERGDRLGLVEPPRRVNYRMMLSSNHIACSSAIVDTTACGKALFPDLQMRQDHALWLQLLRSIAWAHGVSTPLMRYRVRPGSVSSNKWKAARYSWRLLTEIEGLSLPHALFHFVRYTYLAAAKRSWSKK